MLVGTWVHGLFVVGQTPWALAAISNLPAMRGKQAAVFCTFALNPGRSLDKLTGAVEATGASVIGGLGAQPLQAGGAQRGVRQPTGRRDVDAGVK